MGINTSHKGLSVRLLRSASLLGLLHLYRFIFVVGVLQVSTGLTFLTFENVQQGQITEYILV